MLLISFLFAFLIGLPALSALSLDNNTRAGAVRTKNSTFKIKSSVLVRWRFCRFLEMGTTVHAVVTFRRDNSSTLGAILPWDFFLAIGAFHGSINSF
jgi:hypothetical protein